MIDPVGGDAAALLVREVDDVETRVVDVVAGPDEISLPAPTRCGVFALGRPVWTDGQTDSPPAAATSTPLVSSPLSRSGLASALTGRVFNQMTYSCSADIAPATELSEQASGISPSSSLAHFAKA